MRLRCPRLPSVLPRLARVPPGVWALTYLVMLFLFASLYDHVPGAFYHATVKYETVINDDAGRLLKGLTDEVRRTFVASHGGEVVVADGWRVDVTKLRATAVSFPDTEPGQQVADVRFSIELEQPDPYVVAYVPFSVRFPVRSVFSTGSPGARDRLDIKPLTSTASQLIEVPLQVLFPYKPNGWRNESQALLPLSDDLDQGVKGFWRATQGFPSSLSGNYWRMLHLSAVTITTLGYGDILPVTMLARSLVAAEALLGVVVNGLFVNSLFQSRSK
jgi:hypothetical protein